MANKKFKQIPSQNTFTSADLLVGTKSVGGGDYLDRRWTANDIAAFIGTRLKSFVVKMSSDGTVITNPILLNATFVSVFSGSLLGNDGNPSYDETGNVIATPVGADGYSFIPGSAQITFNGTRAMDEVFTIVAMQA